RGAMRERESDKREDRKIVIVGAGFAGIEAAHEFGRAGIPFTLIDQRNYHLFQPLLYHVATSILQDADIAAPARSLVSRFEGAEVLMDKVLDIDVPTRNLVTEAGIVPYDHLILATGAQTSYFGNDHFAEHAFPLKTLSDATSLRHQILTAFERAEMAEDEETRRKLITFAIVGGGPNGVGVAVAIKELAAKTLARDFVHIHAESARVVIVEALDQILGGIDPELVDKGVEILKRKGVEIRTGAMVEEVDEEGVVIGGERLEAGTVVWTAGVEVPRLAEWLGAEANKKGQVQVEPDLRVPGHPEIFVTGDAALSLDDEGKPHPGLAANAKQQGRFAARAIIAMRRGEKPTERYVYNDYGTMVPLGRFSAIAEIKGRKLTGFIAWAIWAVVHIFYLMDLRRRILVSLNWFSAYVTQRRGSRIILSGEDVELPEATRTASRRKRVAQTQRTKPEDATDVKETTQVKHEVAKRGKA
ncbi:MAG TPA: NAD(P)/FAD-dependent oxidoreductase, partial [Saliniramus sp.]|nr:NAD(P)/FAD-dependent oxidoreductase [Saliniramus sp.]